jgi:hypothetical protein
MRYISIKAWPLKYCIYFYVKSRRIFGAKITPTSNTILQQRKNARLFATLK